MKDISKNTFGFNPGISGWLEYFRHSQPLPGGSDILCAGWTDPYDAAAGFAATISGFSKAAGEPLYLRVLVIFPPTALDSQSSEELVESFFSKVMEYVSQDFIAHGLDLDIPAVGVALRHRIKIEVPNDQQTSSLVDIFSSVPASTAVFVINADLYSPRQDSDVSIPATDSASPGGGLQGHLGEDLWVRNLYQTATELTRLATERGLLSILFVQRNEPTLGENIRLLHSIENCALAFATSPTSDQSDESVLISNMNRWLELARAQRIDEVIKEIEDSPLSPINRALVKAQCLMVAGRPLLSFDIIEPFLDQIMGGEDTRLLLKSARIATQAGHYSVALNLLRAALQSSPSEEFDLNLAYDLANTLGAIEEQSWSLERLTKLYPDSVTVIEHRFGACREREDFRKLAEEITSKFKADRLNDEIRFIHLLAVAFAASEVPDYHILVEDIASELPSYRYRAILACARHAMQRGMFNAVANLCLDEQWPEEIAAAATRRVISALEGLLLMRKDPREDENEIQGDVNFAAEDPEGLIHRCIIFILDYLSREAGDGAVRAGLSRTLSPEIAGLSGIVHLTSIILKAPSPDVNNSGEAAAFNAESLPEDEFLVVWEAILASLPTPLVLGVGRLPPLPNKPPLDRLLKSVIQLLWHTSQKTIIDESDVRFICLLLHVGILLSREIGMEYEADLIGLAASGLCTTGNYQPARNLAELCLQLASPLSSNLRRREAWLRYSDIYLRCHSPLEALIGLGCALRCKVVSISADYRYHEIVLTCRTLRDLRMFPYALSIISLAREQALVTSNPRQNAAQLDHLEISLLLQMLTWKGAGISPEKEVKGLIELGKQTMKLNLRARTNKEDVLPTALILAQIIQRLSEHGHPIDEELKNELDASLPLVGEIPAALLRAFEGAEPSADTIEMLGRGLPKTRYNEDLGTDVTMITLIACRALSVAAKSDDTHQALYLLEWLTDLSLNSFESDRFTRSDNVDVAERAISAFIEAAASHPGAFSHKGEFARLLELDKSADPSQQVSGNRYPVTAEDLTEFISEISTQELDVHCIGVDSTDALVRVSAIAGELSLIIETPSVFDLEAHWKWEEKYPYGYTKVESNDAFARNIVEQGLDRIGITAQETGRPTLLVPDIRLQNIPPNLLLVNRNIAGYDRAMASAPSLTWLRATRSSNRLLNGKRHAWIPASDKSDDILSRLTEELTDTLTGHQFAISRDSVMPSDMLDVDIGILGAHGGIHGENEWFRLVADERSTRLTARDVAAKLRGSGVVVLFVCSGGRLDRHPYASASVGLPHLLLDYGCRAVIASPWPLDVRVAGYWLPTFLESFLGGENVVTANYIANQEVARRFSPHPMLSLAMNIVGDPLTKHET